jgi:mono/diheme cytochrome c family protein
MMTRRIVTADVRIICAMPSCVEAILKRNLSAVLVLIWTPVAWAQQADGNLTEQQLRGRQVLAQSCGVCHLQPSMGAKTYGPPLNKASANSNADILRTFILEGTPRMPAFKHYLKTADVDAIINYVRTVPVAADAAAAR